MDDQHNGGGLPPDETPHVVYPDDPDSALHPDIELPLPRALASGGGTRTPPPPPSDGTTKTTKTRACCACPSWSTWRSSARVSSGP